MQLRHPEYPGATYGWEFFPVFDCLCQPKLFPGGFMRSPRSLPTGLPAGSTGGRIVPYMKLIAVQFTTFHTYPMELRRHASGGAAFYFYCHEQRLVRISAFPLHLGGLLIRLALSIYYLLLLCISGGSVVCVFAFWLALLTCLVDLYLISLVGGQLQPSFCEDGGSCLVLFAPCDRLFLLFFHRFLFPGRLSDQTQLLT
ncbi:hypothetical protein BJX61DRAFT_279380 [Aspergillus egyptiacus]|nr:hypothetical protein BJX61DRAFT_279380 [Aspergillus egyptiacus]